MTDRTDVEPAPRLDEKWSLGFREWVAACLEKDPALRPTADELARLDFCRIAPPQPAADATLPVVRRWLDRRAVEELVATLAAAAAHLRQLQERGAAAPCGAPPGADAPATAAWLLDDARNSDDEPRLAALADQLDLPRGHVEASVAAFLKAAAAGDDAAAAARAAVPVFDADVVLDDPPPGVGV